jgi:K+-transporting ATPase ATPase C chain
MRRQLLTGLLMTIAMIVLVGLVYPLVMTGITQVAFNGKANGSLVKVDGQVVGSSLIGQNFLLEDGSPAPKYFQPRPSAAGDGYDAMSSGGTNHGPSNASLIGNVPGVAIDPATGKPWESNPYASPSDPYCVPVQATDEDGNGITDKAGNAVYEENDDGTYVCDSSTVPQRVLAYRSFNGLSADAKVPVDAVTASASGLDPDISVANARFQAARVAEARKLPVDQVLELVDAHTDERPLGFLGEQTVNVLDLNLALDRIQTK